MIYLCRLTPIQFSPKWHITKAKGEFRQTWHRIHFIRDLVPSDIKLSHSLSIFKRKIKKWLPLQYPCRLCKIFLQHVRFIQWTPENSLHWNGGVPLSVSLINVWTMCLSASLFTLIWEILSGLISKNYTRKPKPNNCPCRMCKVYLNGVGYK